MILFWQEAFLRILERGIHAQSFGSKGKGVVLAPLVKTNDAGEKVPNGTHMRVRADCCNWMVCSGMWVTML
jgi:hypothetical protein